MGRVVFVDDGPDVAAEEAVLAGQAVPAALRRLDDGRRYRVVKVFHDPLALAGDLTALGWSVRVRTVGGRCVGGAGPPVAAVRDRARHRSP